MQITKSRSSRVEKELDKEIPKILKNKKSIIKPYIIYWMAKNPTINSLKNWSKRGKYKTLDKAVVAMNQLKKTYSSFDFLIKYEP